MLSQKRKERELVSRIDEAHEILQIRHLQSGLWEHQA